MYQTIPYNIHNIFSIVIVINSLSGRANMSYTKPMKNKMPMDDVTISNEVQLICIGLYTYVYYVISIYLVLSSGI